MGQRDGGERRFVHTARSLLTVGPLPHEKLVVAKWRKGQTLEGRRGLGSAIALDPPIPKGLRVDESVEP